MIESLNDVSEYDKNPRKIQATDFNLLVDSLRNYGDISGVVFNIRNQQLVGGHRRIDAFKLSEAQVQYIERFDPATPTGTVALGYIVINGEKYNYREVDWDDLRHEGANIAANKIGGEWDWDKLANEFDVETLKANGWKEAELYFIPDEVKGGNTEDDKIPERKEKSDTKVGDVYILGKHRIMCGDSTNLDHVRTLMHGQHADIVFTSPPYSNMRDYNNKGDLSVEHLASFLKTYADFSDYFVVNIGIQRKNGEIYPFWDTYTDVAHQAGMKMLAWNVWARGEARSMAQHSAFIPIAHEWIFVYGKKRGEIKRTKQAKQAGKITSAGIRQRSGEVTRKKYTIHLMKKMNSVSNISVETIGIHPAMFPVALPQEYILAMVPDLVVDPFLGAGTTVIAAEKTQRICYGMELDPTYVDLSVKRWEDFTGKTARLERS